jgi:hypothetical protein
MSEMKDGCVKPARGVISQGPPTRSEQHGSSEEAPAMMARVGKEAPDFEANAFVKEGFKPVRLSQYKGKWIVLCFYPGDFTFV